MGALAHPTKLCIDGLWRPTAIPHYLQLINPAAEDFITEIAAGGCESSSRTRFRPRALAAGCSGRASQGYVRA